MDASAILHNYIDGEPEHPVPHVGDIVHLVYPPREGTVGVTVMTSPDDTATLTVVVPASELPEVLEMAQAAAARGIGGPQQSITVDEARGRVGAQAFDARVGQLVRTAFFAVATMRTRILPFLVPDYLPAGPFVPGRDYAFQVRVTLRPAASLSSYEPAHPELPSKHQVSDLEVDNRLSEMIGGSIPWDRADVKGGDAYKRASASVRQQLEREADASWHDAATNACVDALAARLDTVPPRRHVEMLRDRIANDFAAEVEREGTKWEDYIDKPGFSLEDFKTQCTESAMRSLRRGMVLDAVALHLGLAVTEDEVMAAVTEMAPGHEGEALQGLLASGQLPQLCETTLRVKCGNYLLEQAAGE